MQSKVYNSEGNETKTIDLPDGVFNLPWNADLVHQVATSMQSNMRSPIAHTKGRGDVRGGGRKPWKQKGTGRARHGSIRSPLWRGGGVTFGPTNERNFQKKINRKMKVKALLVVLSEKLRQGEILFINTLDITEKSAKKGRDILKNLEKINGFEKIYNKKRNSAYVSLPDKDENIFLSFRNFGNIEVQEARNINVLDCLKYKYLVIVNPEEFVRLLKSKI